MLACPSSIDLASRTLHYLTGQLVRRRREIGTRWRCLTADRQALVVLAHLRCGDTYAQLAAGFGIGVATIYRYPREAAEVLAALAPTPAEAMNTVQLKAFAILDGTLLPIDGGHLPAEGWGRSPPTPLTTRAVRMMVVSFRPWFDSYSGWLLVPCV